MSTFTVKLEDFEITLSEEHLRDLDMVKHSEGTFHVILDHQNFEAALVQADFENKRITIAVNGTPYEVKILDEYDHLISKMGLSVAKNLQQKTVKAPMPGLILEVLVEEGQALETGDQLVILEAMKMENILKSSGSGTVKHIHVQKGDAVEKGQLLIEME